MSLDTTATIESPATRPVLRKPEVLAPAGDWDCARAAVENGADAIYFGVGRYNARVRAKNFTEADLSELMAFLHRRGVRGYVAFNTLIFADELAGAETALRTIIAAGVDAAIIQDVGICRLIRRISPDFPIHASTQMTVTSDAGLTFARELWASLTVLARECSISEMEKMRAALGGEYAIPIEVFVHGALCVAYSGQCLTSESLGGRSANRGECAQACRMPYELYSDGKQVPLGDRKYLLSPQDLAGLDALPELIRAGVSSLKIEGRLKSPEYVANLTRVYRQSVDRVYAALVEKQDASTGSAVMQALQGDFRYDMEMGFSRGLFTGWLRGVDNRSLVHARFGTKRGVRLGTVVRVEQPAVWLRPEAPLKAGDGLVFDAGKPEEGEEGGRIYRVDTSGQLVKLTFNPESINWRRVAIGQIIWKTNDPELDNRIRATYEGDKVRTRRTVHGRVHGSVGCPLVFELRDEKGHAVRGESAVPLQAAQKQPLTADFLRQQLGRLGGTPFELGGMDVSIDGAVMLPVSELNKLRRDVADRLDALRTAPLRWTMSEGPSSIAVSSSRATSATAPDMAEIIPLIRSPEQLEAVIQWGARTIYAEFEDPKRYREAVNRVRACNAADGGNRELWVAPPRIFKMGEEWILRIVRSAEADGYLVRNHEHLRAFADARCRGDFSLNIANPLTAEYFIERHGLERLTASYDLNIAQLDALLRAAPPAWFEITLHQHMPMFHMEHCVFCAFMSTGKDYKDCGRPCDKHDVRLKDRVGAMHTLKADAGCRNTLFNSRAQTGAEYAQHLMDRGVRYFRIEFVSETAEEVQRTLTLYQGLLRGEVSGQQLWSDLKLQNQLGVTRGTLG
ncbi:MAG: DUF3656 domain-containing protein [Verrucomicrobiota bacterium]|nr:DUF3656 domain-containing protein [Verrucomicrobiota bacterium]